MVLVGMGTPEESAAFVKKLALPFPLISDPDRQVYQAFGLKTVSTLELFAPSLVVKAVTAMVQGYTIGMPIGNIRQLPGVFIIDTRGGIVFSHIAKDAADHPDTDAIPAVLNTLR